MRYDIRESGKRNIDRIIVTHNNEKIDFNSSQKVDGGNANQELFEFLNEYFAGEKKENLDKLFGLLKEAKTILDPGYFGGVDTPEIIQHRENGDNYIYIVEKLRAIVEEIYKVITPYNICYAAEMSGKIQPPKDLMRLSQMGDYPESTTIDENKYRELAKLAFVAQVPFPIISELLTKVEGSAGKAYKDGVAGKVMELPVINDLRGWKVLNTYVRSRALQSSKNEQYQTAEVVSEERAIDFIVYKGLFNKLCLTFIPSKDKNKNLSKALNSLVASEVRPQGNIKFKKFNQRPSGVEELSIIESYQASQTVNGTDESAQCEYFTFGLWDEKDQPRTTGCFHYQCLGLGIQNEHIVERLFFNFPNSDMLMLTMVHNNLLQLAFRGKVSLFLYPALDQEQLRAALCLAQVKLWEMGYENLAVLCGMVRDPNGDRTHLEDEFKISSEERQMLVDLCYVYAGQTKEPTDNLLSTTMTDFLDEIKSSAWKSNIECGLLGEPKFVAMLNPSHDYEVVLSREIKEEILKLTIEANS